MFKQKSIVDRIVRRVAVAALTTTVLVGISVPAEAAVPAAAAVGTVTSPSYNKPFGNFDGVAAVASGIKVWGWAADRDTTAALTVRITVAGAVYNRTANVARPDVFRAFPSVGGYTGFSTVIALASGTYPVCVTALNVGLGVDKVFTCRTVTVLNYNPSVTVAAPLPIPAPVVVPGASNTGVPAGTTLTVHEGDLTVTVAGTVVDSMDIRGYLRIKAPNVTVKNSIIRGRAGLTGSMSLIQNSSSGVVIQDSELVAAYPTAGVDGFVGSNATFTRVNIHGVIDSIKLTGDNVVIQDSWLHDNLYYATTPAGHDTHNDNVQIQKGLNITIRNNVMTGTRNAVIMVTQDRGDVGNLVITGNNVDNGTCSVNIAQKTYGPIEGLQITDNKFGTGQLKARCAIIAPTTTTSISTITGNTFTDGSAFAVTRG